MKFKVDNKVQIKEEKLMLLSQSIIKEYKNGAVVITEGDIYTELQFFSTGRITWLSNTWLKSLLTKNQQLLFDFMSKAT